MECSAAGVMVVTDHHKGGQLKVEDGVALLESAPHSQLSTGLARSVTRKYPLLSHWYVTMKWRMSQWFVVCLGSR